MYQRQSQHDPVLYITLTFPSIGSENNNTTITKIHKKYFHRHTFCYFVCVDLHTEQHKNVKWYSSQQRRNKLQTKKHQFLINVATVCCFVCFQQNYKHSELNSILSVIVTCKIYLMSLMVCILYVYYNYQLFTYVIFFLPFLFLLNNIFITIISIVVITIIILLPLIRFQYFIFHYY